MSAPDNSRSISGGRQNLWAFIFMALVIAAVYLPITNQDFINWDDPKHIRAVWKPTVERAWRIVTDFDLKYTGVAYYSPLHFLSLMADQIFILPSNSPQARPAKITNLVLHIINSMLVFWLLIKLGMDRRAALPAALLFAVHPIQVGTVAWVAERKNLLATVFYSSSLLCFLSCVERRTIRHVGLLLIFFVLGLLSKPSTITLPAVMAAFLLLRPRKPESATTLWAVGLPAVIGAAWAAYVVSTEVSYPGILPAWQYRPLLAAGCVWFYLSKLVYPADLVPVYTRWNLEAEILVFGGLFAALCLLTILLILFRKQIDSLVLFGLIFFMINILPVSGFVAFGHMGHSFVADHFMYLPMIGIAVVAGRFMDLVFARTGSRASIFTLVLSYALIASLAVCSIRQVHLWDTSETLWEATEKVTKTSAAVYSNYAAICMEKGDYEKALSLFEKSAELSPELDVPYSNMGRIYRILGQREKARQMFEKTQEVKPGNVSSIIMLATMFREESRNKEAAAFLEKAVEKFPDNAVFRNELGVTYLNLGDDERALREFQTAGRLEPLLPDPYAHQASIYLGRNKPDSAVALLRKGLELGVSPEAQRMLGIAYAQKGLLNEALQELHQSYKMRPNHPEIRDNMANVLLDLGQDRQAEAMCLEAEKIGLPCSGDTLKRLRNVEKVN